MLLRSLGLIVVFGALLAACGPNIQEQFQKAQEEGSLDALDAFEAQNPEHPYSAEVAQLREDIRFREAESEGTVAGMEAFLRDFPDGSHQEEANAALDGLRWKEASAAKKIPAYRAYLKHHPEGKSAKKAKKAIQELMLAKLADAASAEKVERFLAKKGLAPSVRDKALRLLDRRLQEEAGDAGLVRMPKEEDGKMLSLGYVRGHGGAKLFTLDAGKFKLPKSLTWKKKGKKVAAPKAGGALNLALLEGEPADGPYSLVALLQVGGELRILSSPVKLKVKPLIKKKKATVKAKLGFGDAPAAGGEGELHLMIVAGDVPATATELKPVSNIVSVKLPVEVPEAPAAPAEEAPAESEDE